MFSIFKAWDDDQFDWQAAVIHTIRKNINTLVKTDENRYLWGSARWQAHHVGDD